jgi:hypothetical protein
MKSGNFVVDDFVFEFRPKSECGSFARVLGQSDACVRIQ